MNASQIQNLYPIADTIDKAIGFISCAAKQGRQQVRMKAPYPVAVRLIELGFSTRNYTYPTNDLRVFTVEWT